MSSHVIPTFRYRDAPAAIEFLCDALGFQRHLVVEGDDGRIDHAQLTLGRGMIMLGSARDDDFGRLLVAVDQAGGVTSAAYVVVEDVAAHAARARSVGAEIVQEPEDQPYGGSLYTCRDPEGYVWSFGSYDPWRDD